MRALRRFLVVLMAYLFAAFVGAAAILAYGFFSSDGRSWDLNEVLFGLLVLVPAASIYALPVALPVIVLTELRKLGHWAVFAIAGLVLGALLTIAFTEVPYQGPDFKLGVAMAVLSVSGAMTYWLAAWRILPRVDSASPQRGVAG